MGILSVQPLVRPHSTYRKMMNNQYIYILQGYNKKSKKTDPLATFTDQDKLSYYVKNVLDMTALPYSSYPVKRELINSYKYPSMTKRKLPTVKAPPIRRYKMYVTWLKGSYTEGESVNIDAYSRSAAIAKTLAQYKKFNLTSIQVIEQRKLKRT